MFGKQRDQNLFRPEPAREDYSAAINLDPNRFDVWEGRARVYLQLHMWDKSVADYSRAIQVDPHVHTAWWHRGLAYLELKQWDEAAANFTRIVEEWPTGAEGWYLRGVAYAQLNQPDKAVADFRQAIAKEMKDMGRFNSDTRLEPLRANDQFKKLLYELETKKAR